MVAVKEGERILPKEFYDNMAAQGDRILRANLGIYDFLPYNKEGEEIVFKEETETNPVQVNIGDIILQGVQDPDGLAKAIELRFPRIMSQVMSRRY